MLDPVRAYNYNIVLSIFVGIFVTIIVYLFINKSNVVIVEDKQLL